MDSASMSLIESSVNHPVGKLTLAAENVANNSEESVAASRLRSNLSQILACSAVNLFKLNSGLFIGFTTLLLGELYKEDSEIKLSVDELSWYGSYCFTPAVGSLIIGAISWRVGNTRPLLFTLVIYSLCWILYYFVTDVAFLLIIQILAGLTIPVALVPGATYVAEVTQPHLRSVILASGNLLMTSGSFLSILLGTVMYWRTVALINLAFPIISFVAIYFIPESPQWLADKGKFEEAEKSLTWLRGWTTPSAVRDELTLLKCVNRNKRIQLRNSENKSNKLNLKIYLQRSFIAPLAIICLIFGVQGLGGSWALSAYVIITFDMLQSPVDSHVLTLIYDALRIAGAIICTFIIEFTGKRRLMFISTMGSGSCYIIIATFHILVKEQIVPNMYSWLPTIALQLATFFTAAGIDKLTYMYNVELFPSEFRNVGTGVGSFIKYVMLTGGNKIFLYAVNAITLQGVFIFFGIVNIVGVVCFYFLLPETSGKTLVEIEDFFTVDKKSKSDSRSDNTPHSVLE